MPIKVHTSAICIIPPAASWSQIQAIRAVHDKSYIRWMPHINLMYPFYEDEGSNFQKAAESAAKALQNFEPFKVKSFFFIEIGFISPAIDYRFIEQLYFDNLQISLGEFKYFRHYRSSTLWLDPQTTAKNSLRTLHEALLTVFPDCKDLSNDPKRGINGFTPHLSVGQWGKNLPPKSAAADAIAQQAQQELQLNWNPNIEFEVSSVALISRKGNSEPFSVRYRVPLGDGGGGGNVVDNLKVEEVNELYIAEGAS